jgi:dynein-related subfamily AAA family protein
MGIDFPCAVSYVGERLSSHRRYISMVSVGTVVNITRIEGEYVATTETGHILTPLEQPHLGTMKQAFQGNLCLQLVKNDDGSKRWRKYPRSLWNPHMSTAVLGAVANIPMIDNNASHADIVDFIKKSIGLKPTLLKIDDLRWRFAIRAAVRGENLLVRGDHGCGKTMLATTIPTVLGRQAFVFNLGATQDPRSALIGNTHFKKDEGTYVAEALFVKAIQTPNAVIILDEVSRAHPDAHNILMSVLDQRQRYLRIDERPDTPTITVAPGVVFLGTANVGSEYTATRTMDRAFVDRWTTVMMDPLGLTDEIELLTEMFPNLNETDIKAIAEIAVETRKQVKTDNPKVSTILSTRTTTEMAALMYDGFTLSEAAEVKIYPFYSDANGVESERTFMKQLVQRSVPTKTTGQKTTPFTTAIPSSDPNKGKKKPFGNKGP